jgi:Skp family chaperone for outer membrane proteins
MKRTLFLTSALAAGLATSSIAAFAQAAKPAAPAAPAAVAPEAIPAKVAIIAFEEAVAATNEGQTAFQAVQKKYEPKRATLEASSKEVDTLKQQLQALPANAGDEQRATLIKNIDTKEKALQRDGEDATNAYQSDIQEAFGKVAQKLGATAVKYAQAQGFTVLLNYPDPRQQTPNQILWFTPQSDVTQAVVNEYNKVSGVAAPPPSAPAPARTAPAPARK